ncbi:MAG: glycerophosphodiester phosphodiesterase [Vicinamibacteraceae bacterium]
MRSRREFLAAIGAASLRPWPTPSARMISPGRNRDMFLIAHRGGVVDETHPENSPASVEAAIARGYWMLEVDIRRSRDGQAIVQHDPTFDRFYGVSRAVDQMTWNEIAELRATPGNTRPMRFDELCARCAGRTRLMLDIKGADHADAFYDNILSRLRRHNLLETTYALSGGRIPELTNGFVARAVDRRALAAAVERGEPVARICFLFELGSVLDEEALQLCREHRVTPVAALNTFRYEQAKVDHWKGAEADVRRLRSLGVQHFQIDSIYDRYFT